MFSRSGAKAYKADLGNISRLCEIFDHPEKKITTIHIAGTNGKGSVSNMLAATLQNNNFNCGLYTSPHLYDFRERIRIDGKMISKDFVINFVENWIALPASIQPSFFELTFAMALQYFAVEKVDIAVIETGLGGRLDSTNIIQPVLSVITNIGYDHMDILGDTLEKIANEKAGIIKKQTPVVIGETHPETKNVFIKKAKEMDAAIVFAEDVFKIGNVEQTNNYLSVEIISTENQKASFYKLDLRGNYQAKNLRTSIAALDQLKKTINLKEHLIHNALSNVSRITGLKGRWEVVCDNPKIITDVAHNMDGILQVTEQLKQINYNQLHWVIGMVADKDIESVLKSLPKKAIYYFTKADNPRALPETDLQKKANQFNLQGKTYSKVIDAVNAAVSNFKKDDLIMVCGSVFIVAEVIAEEIKKS